MVTAFFRLLDLPDFAFSENEMKAFWSPKEATRAFGEWCKCWKIPYENVPHRFGSSSNITSLLLLRSTLQDLIARLILSEPTAMHKRFNALLAGVRTTSDGNDADKIPLLDCLTERPFEYSQIPRECFPKESDVVPEFVESAKRARKEWDGKRLEVIRSARSRMPASKSAASAQTVTAGWGGPSAGLVAAQADLVAARMRARALR